MFEVNMKSTLLKALMRIFIINAFCILNFLSKEYIFYIENVQYMYQISCIIFSNIYKYQLSIINIK